MAGIYVHIPFCFSRCIYCDFYSTTQLGEYRENYLTALERELSLRRDYLSGEEVQSIYIGGGTPSLLSAADLERIFRAVTDCHQVTDGAEITIEANPDDLSASYVNDLIRLPVNRISMGVQSFNDACLRFLHRRHTARQAVEAVMTCKKAGLMNISIDLMFGLPRQTLEDWEYNLNRAIELNVPHISAYSLTYEEGTALYRMREDERILPVEEDTFVEMMILVMDMLSHVYYDHYEISNFARPGYRSRHNSSYWNGEKYLGVGASAHSYNGNSRQWNVSSVTHYIKGITEGILPSEVEALSPTDTYNEYIITRLRRREGVNLKELESMFGHGDLRSCLRKAVRLIKRKLLVATPESLALTRDGLLVADSVIRCLMK
jgi:oxygen-independent coproporphyrinogen-3 oxidase